VQLGGRRQVLDHRPLLDDVVPPVGHDVQGDRDLRVVVGEARHQVLAGPVVVEHDGIREAQPDPRDPARAPHHQLDPVHVPGPERGQLERRGVEVGLEGRRARGDRRHVPAGLTPVLEHQPGAVRGLAQHVLRSGRAQRPGHEVPHLLEPTSRPDTKCFWNMKKMIAVGSAATAEPAATTFHELEKPPWRLSSAAVIGNRVSVRSTVIAQIRSLKI